MLGKIQYSKPRQHVGQHVSPNVGQHVGTVCGCLKFSCDINSSLTLLSSWSIKHVCWRFLLFAFNILFVSSVFAHRIEYVLPIGNMPVMMVVIFGLFFIKGLAIFMTPTAMSSGWLWPTLFLPQCIITNNVAFCKEISRAVHNTITTDNQVRSTFKIVLPNMSVSSQTCRNRLTNYNDWCGRVLEKFFQERICFLPSKFV